MLFPVALTHATEQINWIRILFSNVDFCLPLPPPGSALFKADISEIEYSPLCSFSLLAGHCIAETACLEQAESALPGA